MFFQILIYKEDLEPRTVVSITAAHNFINSKFSSGKITHILNNYKQ